MVRIYQHLTQIQRCQSLRICADFGLQRRLPFRICDGSTWSGCSIAHDAREIRSPKNSGTERIVLGELP